MATIIELLLLARRFNIDPEQLIARTFELVPNIHGINKNTALVAAHFMNDFNFNTFDAIHAAFCGTDTIVSSDKIYKKAGLSVCDLKCKDF